MVQADRNQPVAERLREVAADEDRPIERFRHSLDPAPPKSNSSPVTQMRCMITASLRATATVARFMPRRLATEIPQACRRDRFRERVISTDAAS